jgi:hypothetical protein
VAKTLWTGLLRVTVRAGSQEEAGERLVDLAQFLIDQEPIDWGDEPYLYNVAADWGELRAEPEAAVQKGETHD